MADLLCSNARGEIVLRGSVWKQTYKLVLSVYAYKGIKSKRQTLLMRSAHRHDEYHPDVLEVMLENMAHLWAMEVGVSNYTFTRRNADHRELFHPSELTKENQS